MKFILLETCRLDYPAQSTLGVIKWWNDTQNYYKKKIEDLK